MKKFLLSFSFFSVFASFSVFAMAPLNEQVFSDVSVSSPNFEAISFVKSEGIVKGYDDGTFRPDNKINRAEFTKIIVGANYTDVDIKGCSNTYFEDVKMGEWYHSYVCLAKKKGLIDGYPDGTFRPSDNISFVEASKIISNSFGFKADKHSIWYKPFVLNLSDKFSIPTSIESFEYEITRGEMAEIIWRLKEDIKDKPYMTYADFVEEEEVLPSNVVCKMDAKICPDGSSVGRTGSNCEFAACPDIDNSGLDDVIPTGCIKYYDGCNICSVNADGSLGACTQRYCLRHEEPYCMDD